MELAVTVVYSPGPRQAFEVALKLPEGTTVEQALRQSGLRERCPDLGQQMVVPGIWGRKADWDQVLRDQDRVELYRPLRVDPKVARRERFAKQGARTTGLFAKRRVGAKPSY